MNTIEPTKNHICPDCNIKLIPSGYGRYRCNKCGYIDKLEYDNTIKNMFGIGG